MSDDKPQFGASVINDASKCGYRAFRKHKLGDRRPMPTRPLVGIASHKAIQVSAGERIRSGEWLPLDSVQDATADAFNRLWDEGVSFTEEEAKEGVSVVKGACLDDAVGYSSMHTVAVAPHIVPTHAEREWVIELEGYPIDLKGTIDLQEADKSVRDTKTTQKKYREDAADLSFQLSLYAIAKRVLDGTWPEYVALDVLRITPKLKERRVQTLVSTRGEEDVAPVLRRVEAVCEMFRREIYVPARQDDWWCSRRYCEFYDDCPFVRRGDRRPTT